MLLSEILCCTVSIHSWECSVDELSVDSEAVLLPELDESVVPIWLLEVCSEEFFDDAWLLFCSLGVLSVSERWRLNSDVSPSLQVLSEGGVGDWGFQFILEATFLFLLFFR